MANQRDEIVAEIQALMLTVGDDWVKPFRSLAVMPTNAVTGKQYSGLNAFYLALRGQAHWAGYKQWKSIGAQVKKGEKATVISLPRMKKNEISGEMEMKGFMGAAIFHSDQVEGWEAPAVPEKADFDRDAELDAFIAGTGADISYTPEGAAYYRRDADTVHVPLPELFDATEHSTAKENFYSTILHELAHWTGHAKRLDRKKGQRFGDADYSFEELVAESAAAIASVELGISHSPRPDHAQYLTGWAKKLTTQQFADAMKLGFAAVDYLKGLQIKTTQEAA